MPKTLNVILNCLKGISDWSTVRHEVPYEAISILQISFPNRGSFTFMDLIICDWSKNLKFLRGRQNGSKSLCFQLSSKLLSTGVEVANMPHPMTGNL